MRVRKRLCYIDCRTGKIVTSADSNTFSFAVTVLNVVVCSAVSLGTGKL